MNNYPGPNQVGLIIIAYDREITYMAHGSLVMYMSYPVHKYGPVFSSISNRGWGLGKGTDWYICSTDDSVLSLPHNSGDWAVEPKLQKQQSLHWFDGAAIVCFVSLTSLFFVSEVARSVDEFIGFSFCLFDDVISQVQLLSLFFLSSSTNKA